MRRFLTIASMGLLLVACEGRPEDVPSALEVKQDSSSIQGTYRHGEDIVQFRSRETQPGVFDVVVDVHGMTLSALVDRNRQVAEVDGFAAGGDDTQIVEDDRGVLVGLSQALSAQAVGEQEGAASILARLVSNWSQQTDTVPLQRQVASSENRGWTSLCSSYKKYVSATHDDGTYAEGSPRSTSYGRLGDRTTSTYYYVSGAWTTKTQDHVAGLYEYGNCYGNCGPSCPSGVQTLTLDCHNHDQCVRNGHALASLWCDDEFTSASDDELFAPRCSGT